VFINVYVCVFFLLGKSISDVCRDNGVKAMVGNVVCAITTWVLSVAWLSRAWKYKVEDVEAIWLSRREWEQPWQVQVGRAGPRVVHANLHLFLVAPLSDLCPRRTHTALRLRYNTSSGLARRVLVGAPNNVTHTCGATYISMQLYGAHSCKWRIHFCIIQSHW
jgi:hypothetical protein